jgi:hypothetical protein
VIAVREDLGQCEYSVDVSAWYDRRRERLEESDVEIDLKQEGENDLWEFADGFLNEDGEWECYRQTRPGDSYCLFHAHESDDGIEHAASPGQV